MYVYIFSYLLKENHFCPALNATGPEANQSCPDRSPVIPEVVMWVGCGVLLVYSLSITCITSVIWVRMKTWTDSTQCPVQNLKMYVHLSQIVLTFCALCPSEEVEER